MGPTDLLGKNDKLPGGGKTGSTILGLPECNVEGAVEVIESDETRGRGPDDTGTSAGATF